MPLLRGKRYNFQLPPDDLKPEEEVFVVKPTNEVCRSYDDYVAKVLLYKSQMWTCRFTNKANLDFDGALESEQKIFKLLAERFPRYFEKPILQLVHQSTSTCAVLAKDAVKLLNSKFFEGEEVSVMNDENIYKNCFISKVISKKKCDQQLSSSPSRDKENSQRKSNSPEQTDSLSVIKDIEELSYDVKGNNDLQFEGVSSSCLQRTATIPSTKLIKLFIRANAVLESHKGTNVWLVEEHLVKKYSLMEKLEVFPSKLEKPSIFKTPEMAKTGNAKKIKKPKKRQLELPKKSEDGKSSQKKLSCKSRKLDPGQSKLDCFRVFLPKLDTCSPVKVTKTCLESKMYSPVTIIDKPDGESVVIHHSAEVKKKKRCLVKDFTNSSDHTSYNKSLITSNVETGISSDSKKLLEYDEKKRNKLNQKASVKPNMHSKTSSKVLSSSLAQNLPLPSSNVIKVKSPLKSIQLSPQLIGRCSVEKSSLEVHLQKHACPQGTQVVSVEDDDFAVNTPKRQLKNLPNASDTPKEKYLKKKPGLKQTTIFDMATKSEASINKKERNKPNAEFLSLDKWTERLSEAVEKKQAKVINNMIKESQEKYLISSPTALDLKTPVKSALNIKWQNHMVKLMTKEEKEKFLEERKQKRREEVLKLKLEREKQKSLESKRYEDTTLELVPLPTPTPVTLPKEISQAAFADVLMLIEFVSGFKTFLTPGRSIPYFTSENLLQSLVSEKDGFPMISKLLVALLQILLQDEGTKGKDVDVPLNEMPLTEYTAFELARLYLEHNNPKDCSTEECNNVMNLLSSLKENEFYSMTAENKLKVLVHLCNEVMASVSFGDHIEQQMEKLSTLRRQIREEEKEKLNEKRKLKKEEKSKQEKQDKETEENKEKKTKQLGINFDGQAAANSDGNKDLCNKENITVIPGEKEDGEKEKQKKIPAQETSMSQAIRSRREQRVLNQAIEEKRKAEEADAIKKQERENEIAQSLDCLRLTPFGSDRYHRRYWLFRGATPGLYVEEGWMGKNFFQCAENKDAVAQDLVECDKNTENNHRGPIRDVVLVENDDESSKQAESIKENNAAIKSKNDVRYSWSCYETLEEIDNLIRCLAVKGIRESALLTALKENREDIVWSVKKRCKSNFKRTEGKENEKDDRLLTSLRDDMVDIAQKVFKGKLCEMKNIDRYEKDVNSAVQPRKLSKLLLKLYESVFPRAHKLQKPENWKEAVQDACTFSRLHLLLDIFDEAILWDKSTERAKCKLCRRKADEKNLLVCCSNSDCALAYHLLCLRPSLDEMPKHSWLCPICQPPETPRSSRRRGAVYAEDDNDMDDDDGADNQDSESNVSSDFHEDYCDVCNEEGDELVCCDTCPSVYHMECHDPPLRNVPRGSWQCCKCRWGITRKSMISAANKKLKAAKKNAKKAAGPKRKRLRPCIEDNCESDSQTEENCSHGSDECQTLNSFGSSNSEPYRKRTRNATKNKQAFKVNANKRQAFEEESTDNGEPLPARKKTKRTSPDRKSTNKRSQKDGSRQSPELNQNSLKKRHRTNPELGKCEVILSKLWFDENSWPFRAPVNTKEVPDYAELVTDPMDLKTVREKLDTIQYKDAGEFVSDIRLIVRNCEVYNLNTSAVGQAGIQIEKYFDNLLKDEFPHLGKSSRRRRK